MGVDGSSLPATLQAMSVGLA